MYEGKKSAWLRFIVSFVLLNLLPLLYFVIVLRRLGRITAFEMNFGPMLGLLMLSLAGFGFYRIYFGVMLAKTRNKYWFYGDGLPEPLQGDIKQRVTGLSEQHARWQAHLVPGMLWVGICIFFGCLLL